MAETTWNGNVVPSGTDFWNLVEDWQRTANNNNRVIPVFSEAERDGLATFAPGGVIPEGTIVMRLDQNGILNWFMNGQWQSGDTGWIDIPLRAGVSVQSIFTPQVRRVRDAVYMRGVIRRTDNTPMVSITWGDLPAGYRPSDGQGLYYAAATDTPSAPGRLIVQVDGSMQASISSGQTPMYMSVVANWTI